MAGIIKKNWQKDAGEVAIEAGCRIGGALLTAFALNKWFSGEPRDGVNKEQAANTAKTMHNISGPLFLGIGVIGDMMMEDAKIKGVFQGMASIGAIQTIATIAPSVTPNDGGQIVLGNIRGLNGVADAIKTHQDAALLSGNLGALNGRARINRPALGATTPAFTGDTPEELKWANGAQVIDTDGKTYNNDWGYLARNIDHADEITTTVNGTDDDSAAALMGVASDEEAALLMGMF